MQYALTLYWAAHREEIDLSALRLIDLSLELVTSTNWEKIIRFPATEKCLKIERNVKEMSSCQNSVSLKKCVQEQNL